MSRSQRHLRENYGRDSLGGAPRINAVPTVAGTTTSGQTLTGTNGTFTGMGTITITRQWYRGLNPIIGATNATYVLTGADVGSVIRLSNIARSVHGARRSFSAATATVA